MIASAPTRFERAAWMRRRSTCIFAWSRKCWAPKWATCSRLLASFISREFVSWRGKNRPGPLLQHRQRRSEDLFAKNTTVTACSACIHLTCFSCESRHLSDPGEGCTSLGEGGCYKCLLLCLRVAAVGCKTG
jgi:hypothetical protein